MTAFVPESPDAPLGRPSDAAGAAPQRSRRDALGEFFSVAGPRPVHRDRSRRMGYAKILLLSLAALLIGVLALWPMLSGKDRLRIGVSSDVQPEDVASLRVTGARLTGVGDTGRPYAVTFANASQTSNDSDLVLMERPQADIELDTGAWIAFSAEKGRFHRANRTIELDAPVRMFHDSGLEFSTGNIVYNLNSNTGAGYDRLTAQAPFGLFESKGFRVREGGAVYQFAGPVRATLYSAPGIGG